jgi:hypothetical protein
MRRKRILTLGLVVVLAAALVWLWPEQGPSYSQFESPVPIPKYLNLTYEFLASDPFQGGHMWISLRLTTNSAVVYRYDIEQRKVLGELRGARPVFEPEPGKKLLCYNRTPPNGFRDRLARFTTRITFGRVQMKTSGNHVETFWLLDLQRNAAVRLGTTEQFAGGGSSFTPSPDRKLAFNKSTGDLASAEVLMFDATLPAIREVTINGWPIGWWNNHEILVKAKDDFMLFDVIAGSCKKFLTVEQLREFFQANKVDAYPKEVSIFSMWNGWEYDFYFTEGQSRWQAVESYLAKIRRPGPTLELIASEFKFEWSDSFDGSGHAYVFSGRRSGDGSSSVRMRDMVSGREKVLVPTTEERNISACPRPIATT